MVPNEESNMKLKNIPYLRIWANLFNYEARLNRKDFIIDLFLFAFVQSLLFVLIYQSLRLNHNAFVVLIINWLAILFLQTLSLFSRRLTDIGMKFNYVFYIFAVLTIPSMIVICLGKSKDEFDENTLNKKNRIRKIFLRLPIGIIASAPCLIVILFFGIMIYDFIRSPRTLEESTDIDKYEKYVEEVKYASTLMPNLDDLNSYTDAKFGYKHVLYFTILGFQSDNISLFVTYDDNYTEEKQSVLSSYDFLKEEELGEFPVTSFDYRGYSFQIVPNRDYRNDGSCTCKTFMMIGYNDANNTIAYLYFYDFDIDYIDNMNNELENFIWYE